MKPLRLAACFLLASTVAAVTLGITGEIDNRAHVRDTFGHALVFILLGCLGASIVLSAIAVVRSLRRPPSGFGS